MYSVMDWKWPLKLLNIQLKIQLIYSHNHAWMRAGKTTITCRNRAHWHTWMKETSQHRTPLGCGTQGHRQAVHLVGGKGGKPWEAAAGGCTTYWEMDCLWERGWCTFLHIALCFGATSCCISPARHNPCRTEYFFPGPPEEVTASQASTGMGQWQVRADVSQEWQSLNTGSVTGTLLKTAVGEEDKLSKGPCSRECITFNYKLPFFPLPVIHMQRERVSQ